MKKILVLTGLSFVCFNYSYSSELHDAAKYGDVNKVKSLLDEGAYVNARDENKNTPLHYAATSKNKEVVQLLLDHKAFVNAPNEVESTPLHKAVSSSLTPKKVVQLLLDYGASVNAVDKRGNTPLDISRNKEIDELLIKNGGKTGQQIRKMRSR
jgi:ankyrin repeat protein